MWTLALVFSGLLGWPRDAYRVVVPTALARCTPEAPADLPQRWLEVTWRGGRRVRVGDDAAIERRGNGSRRVAIDALRLARLRALADRLKERGPFLPEPAPGASTRLWLAGVGSGACPENSPCAELAGAVSALVPVEEPAIIRIAMRSGGAFSDRPFDLEIELCAHGGLVLHTRGARAGFILAPGPTARALEVVDAGRRAALRTRSCGTVYDAWTYEEVHAEGELIEANVAGCRDLHDALTPVLREALAAAMPGFDPRARPRP